MIEINKPIYCWIQVDAALQLHTIYQFDNFDITDYLNEKHGLAKIKQNVNCTMLVGIVSILKAALH